MRADTPGAASLLHDDEALMQKIEAGDVSAFEELYDRYCARAFRVARSVCQDAGRAEEAVQDAFVSIWQGRAAYYPQQGRVAPWLLSVVRYRAIDVLRHNSKHPWRRAGEHLIQARAAPGDIAEQAVARADAANLRALLKGLPHAQQTVIVLAFYGQLSHTEIAAQLGLPTGTVKGRMRLGLQKLRVAIEAVPALERSEQGAVGGSRSDSRQTSLDGCEIVRVCS